MKFHTKYGFGENTRIQFEEFVKSYKKGNTYKPKTYKPKKIKSVKYAKPKSTNNN